MKKVRETAPEEGVVFTNFWTERRKARQDSLLFKFKGKFQEAAPKNKSSHPWLGSGLPGISVSRINKKIMTKGITGNP